MDINQLKHELDLLGVNPSRYSLTGELKADSIIVVDNYGKWEVFYLDERGGRNNYVYFKSEEDACLYVYELFAPNLAQE